MRYEDRSRGNGRDPETIQRDIEQTRRELDRTLEAIQHDLSPSELLRQLLERVRGSGESRSLSDTASRVLGKIRDNPIPSALIAIGVLALAKEAGPSAGDLRDAARSGKERVRSAAERARGAISGGEEEGGGAAAGKVRELAGGAASSVEETAARARESVESGYARIRERIEDDPIVLGALGIALGAALGAGLPRTRFEDEKLGSARDELASSARGAASEARDRAANESTAEPDASPVHAPPVHAPVEGYDPESRSIGEPSEVSLGETEPDRTRRE